MPGLQTAFAQGLAANRPAASAANAGYMWVSTDVGGGTLYQSNGSAWVQIAGGANALLTPLTTKGDLVVGGAAGATSRLGVGSDAQVLTADSTQSLGIKWATPATGFSNPMIATGDMITGGSAGAAGRLGIGSSGQVLTVSGGVPTWASAGSGGALTKIAEVGPLGSAQATAAFSSISGSYRSLLLHWSARVDVAAGQVVQVTLNGDGGSNYDWNNVDLASTTNYGLTTNSTFFAAGNALGTSGTANVFPGGEILILDYTSTAKHKTFITRSLRYDSSSVLYQDQNYGFWHNSTPAAITAVTFTPGSGNFAVGSVFSLYALA